jgi:ribosome recycling factor
MTNINVEDLNMKLNNNLNNFKENIGGLLPGVARPALLENLLTNVNGQGFKLKAKAMINIQSQTQLKVTPFNLEDKKSIEKTLIDSGRGKVESHGSDFLFSVHTLSGDTIILHKKLIKEMKDKYKISIGQIRKDVLKTIAPFERTYKDLYRAEEKKLEKIITDANNAIETTYNQAINLF